MGACSVIRLELPYPISANRYWTDYTLPNTKRSIRGPTKEAKQYKRDVQWFVRAAGLRKPMAGRLKVSIVLIPNRPQDADKRAQKDPEHWDMSVRCLDVDNCVKVTLDALKGVAFEDDDQVHKLDVERGEPGKAGMVVVIERWTPSWLLQSALELEGAA